MNENCLAGKACPRCGSEEPFIIAVTAMAKVWDSGADEFEQVEWEDHAACLCYQCALFGKVSDFTRVDSGLEVQDARDPAVVDFCFPPVNVGVRGGPCLRDDFVPDGVTRDDLLGLEVVAAKWVDCDYDDGGAYWGGGRGDLIWCGYDTKRRIRCYVRAKTEEEARNKVHEVLSQCLEPRSGL